MARRTNTTTTLIHSFRSNCFSPLLSLVLADKRFAQFLAQMILAPRSYHFLFAVGKEKKKKINRGRLFALFPIPFSNLDRNRCGFEVKNLRGEREDDSFVLLFETLSNSKIEKRRRRIVKYRYGRSGKYSSFLRGSWCSLVSI